MLEVGPGFGSLTLPLLAAARALIAVEVDPVLAAELPRTVADRAPDLAWLTVVTADAARIAEIPGPAGPPTVLVANLPYNVAVPVVLHLLATVSTLRGGLVMVQAEVADRMVAGPGSRVYGIPSVKLAWYATARRAGSVPRSVFWPVPRVDSGLVAFERHPEAGGPGREEVFAVVDAAFAQRRKTLRAALAGGLARPPRPSRFSGRRASTPGCAGRHSAWTGSPPSPPRAAAYDLIIVTEVTVRVPAKVNLQLAVGPLRDDGYHDLVTVFHALSLYDEVTVRAAERTSVKVTGQDAEMVPTGRDNLVVRAAAALARAAGRKTGNAVAIEIRKRIPVAAGLAGGSADGAAALVACNALWQAGLSAAELGTLAAGLGSDVAFALLGGTAVGTGRGERLTAALAAGTYHWVLAFAAGGLSTPEVYGACDRLREARGTVVGRPELSTELMAALRAADPAAVGPLLANDLQPAALSLRPELRRALAAGREAGALGAIVSGSGPTCAFLAPGPVQAREIAVSLAGAGVCRSVARVHGPVPGAAVITAVEHA